MNEWIDPQRFLPKGSEKNYTCENIEGIFDKIFILEIAVSSQIVQVRKEFSMILHTRCRRWFNQKSNQATFNNLMMVKIFSLTKVNQF